MKLSTKYRILAYCFALLAGIPLGLLAKAVHWPLHYTLLWHSIS
jgi:hypothetical protein